MSWAADARLTLRRLRLGRLAVTVLLLAAAFLVARFSWTLPLADDAERYMYDVRAILTAPRVVQDPRIVMIVYNDDTLEHTGRRSPLDRGLLAKALTTIDALHPKAIGIDMLIDEPQPEDSQLIAAFRAMKTPTYLGFTTNAANDSVSENTMMVWQEAYERRFQAAIAGGQVHPASVHVEPDPDGVIRSWPDRVRGLPPLLVERLAGGPGAFAGYTRSIAWRLPANVERDVFNELPIDLFADPVAAQFLKSQVEGRYVLIGGDLHDFDRFDTSLSRITNRTISGLEGNATMLAQMLDGRRPGEIGAPILWLSALIVVLAAAALGFRETTGWRLALLLVGSLGLIVVVPVALQAAGLDSQSVPAFGWLIGWTIAYIAAASAARLLGSEQRRFAQGALGRYLPRDVATEILRDPDKLALRGQRTAIYALFTDMEGFTKLTHAIPTETVATLLNRYLDLLSAVVLEHGGTLDKFVGDAVVAFWGAPLARPDDGDRVLAAAIAMAEAGERFRAEKPDDVPPIGRTRVGVHRGEAIVGNFGGEGRIQYTALGDAMNAASRLEGANKALGTRALISAEAAAGMDRTHLRAMGRVAVRGRSTPLTVFEPVPEISAEEVAKFSNLVDSFDAHPANALEELEHYASSRPDDVALQRLLTRLREVGPGGYSALD